jgi:cytochrome c-type biogenesis protein CcmH
LQKTRLEVESMSMMQSWFWYLAGLLSGVAAALIVLTLWQSLAARVPQTARRYLIGASIVLVIGAVVTALYSMVGRPDAIVQSPAPTAMPHPGARAPLPGEAPRSIEQATAELEQRLTRNGGTREDWLLLAQSYEFLGRNDDAARARAQAQGASSASAGPAQPVDERARLSVAEYAKRVAANPRDVESWSALATLRRQQRDYAGAKEAYRHLIDLKAMTADNWADYADALGSLGGSLAGEPARAIDKALALDPRHVKALWLKASLAHEERRYAAALAVWRELRSAMPPDSPDLRIIDDNIAEAARLAGAPATQTVATAPATAVGVTGTVSIDGKLAGRVAPGATLFIYAKDADSPGPPLAVMRASAGQWPVAFRLDDSMAMIPSRRLSLFEHVVIEARVSVSGQAIPAPGDLYVVSPVFRPADGKAVNLVISREVT